MEPGLYQTTVSFSRGGGGGCKDHRLGREPPSTPRRKLGDHSTTNSQHQQVTQGPLGTGHTF